MAVIPGRTIYGTSPARVTTVDVTLFQPVITVSQDSLLTATEGVAYEWFLDGYAIEANQGGTNRTIVGRVSGTYTVKVKGTYDCIVTTPAIDYRVTLIKTLCPNVITSLASNKYANTYQWQRDDGTGFVNITDNDYLRGTNAAFLQLRYTPSTWYGYKFRCITNVGSSDIYRLQYLNAWTGSQNGIWENAANWSCGSIPDTNTDVVISGSNIVISSNVTIRKLTINPGANLTVQPGYTLTITH